MNWNEATLHVIDFEGSKTSGILEFGLVTVRELAIVETRTRLCRPTGRVSPEDARTHGIRAEEAARQAPFDREWDFFLDRRKSGFFAAHFASVENSLIKSVWPYPGEVPDFSGMKRSLSEWGPWVDTGRLLPRLFDGLPGAGLSDLVGAFDCQARLDELAAEHCPRERRGYHCALYDALASTVLLLALADYPEYRERSLGWLLENSVGSAARGERLRQMRWF